MDINVELGNGITIKVSSEKYYSCSDAELANFLNYNLMYPEHQRYINDPFDDSVLKEYFKDDLEYFDDSLDFDPKEWD